jgi:hypothetical protein
MGAMVRRICEIFSARSGLRADNGIFDRRFCMRVE